MLIAGRRIIARSKASFLEHLVDSEVTENTDPRRSMRGS